MTALTQDYLKELLQYDPLTGVFTWRVYRGPNAKVGETAGCVDKDGYRKIKINFRSYWEHRLAFLYMSGTHPNATVDHINGNRSDNRFENLREATHSQNNANKGASRSNKIGLKGVFRQGNRYLAQICINNKRMRLGSFKTAESAHEAYCAAAEKHFGDFARTGWGTNDGASPFATSDTKVAT